MNIPTISVITVTYNALDALKATAQSVVGQDYANMEYLIVDGGSTDGTVPWIERFHSQEQRIDIRFVSERDNGIYDAMNKGVAMSNGDYCIFMNAGDTFVSSTVLSDVISRMEKNTDVVYGDIMKNGRVKQSLSPRNCHKMYYCHQGALTATTCLREYPFDTRHPFSADFKQAKQLFLAGKTFIRIPVTVAVFDTGGVSNTQRSHGLMDNVKVILEVDSFFYKIRFIPKLMVPWIVCRLRGK